LSKYYGVHILGIYGVGGIGKSTTCMVLCNNYFKDFQGRVCHVEFGSGDELQMLQEILKRLTNTKHEVIRNLNKDEV
jgi:GTPase SAR1 family protein